MPFTFVAVAVVAIMVVSATADVVSAAVVSGVFTVINTGLLALLHRRTRDVRVEQKAIRDVITAPRRLVFDQEGKPIGTVLDLKNTGTWDEWLQHSRRATDPEPPMPRF